jgi:hypothetical protein
MRKCLLGGAALLVISAFVWAGGDPWKSKPFQQWTENDIKVIFESSPWARANVQPQGAWRPPDSSGTSGPGIFTRGSSVADGGASKESETQSSSQAFNILWWSARTIRAASLRRAVLHGTMTEAEAEKALAQPVDDYQIFIKAKNMSIFEQRGEKAFENVANLEPKMSKRKISPLRVEFQLGPGDRVIGVIFHFPKKDSKGEPVIAPAEKEVDFFVQVGDTKLLTSFDPRKMVDSQGSDL